MGLSPLALPNILIDLLPKLGFCWYVLFRFCLKYCDVSKKPLAHLACLLSVSLSWIHCTWTFFPSHSISKTMYLQYYNNQSVNLLILWNIYAIFLVCLKNFEESQSTTIFTLVRQHKVLFNLLTAFVQTNPVRLFTTVIVNILHRNILWYLKLFLTECLFY